MRLSHFNLRSSPSGYANKYSTKNVFMNMMNEHTLKNPEVIKRNGMYVCMWYLYFV